ncbi:serine hydrolase domain-containing protein [Nonomuraea gerenzanensis]|uniref:Serine-type D-Ala-D-Ala carboxypeptidase n=1 Tax=Nonomuraea gerenzanensis TaxID=93944 RepID=A0A1M4E9P3_9ACTN|nr:serine hydrolase domain-containing protein [Nonomuraea gerenzanensis]UBU17794.1 beta-lactamase family protein [Nonomuraea gerenzanensis]SBO95575.1 Serine-type D-Ala-D-Ala carboxypeptidase [Nonomuraea gerenzanensis]
MTIRRFSTFASRLAAATLAASLLAAQPAAAQPGAAQSSAAQPAGLDTESLRRTLDAVHAAGMYGTYAHVADGRQSWQGAAGVADIDTRRPVHPGMVHRAGSITKTFTAVAVMQQVGKGTIELDAPIGRYLPDVVPGERGRRITVRMLLNHTSHIANHTELVFPAIESLEANRFRTFQARELARSGLAAPPTGEPGALPGAYSNTNYILAGLLLEKVTGVGAERYITDHVIRKAGLRHTAFPRTPHIPGPNSKAYEALFGLFDPPRDFSVYNMSWAGTAGAVTSTMADLNRFFRLLLGGALLDAGPLAEMQRTVPVRSFSGAVFDYGLGIFPLDLPCGRFWGHDGSVPGMETLSFLDPGSGRQFSLGLNLRHYQQLDENGLPTAHAIDFAIRDHLLAAACGPDATAAAARTAAPPLPLPLMDRGTLTP